MASPLSRLRTPKGFALKNSDLVTENSLKWQLRHRHYNGLTAAGAVLEIRQHRDQQRPRLVIDEDRYFEWLREQGKWLRSAGRQGDAE